MTHICCLNERLGRPRQHTPAVLLSSLRAFQHNAPAIQNSLRLFAARGTYSLWCGTLTLQVGRSAAWAFAELNMQINFAISSTSLALFPFDIQCTSLCPYISVCHRFGNEAHVTAWWNSWQLGLLHISYSQNLTLTWAVKKT